MWNPLKWFRPKSGTEVTAALPDDLLGYSPKFVEGQIAELRKKLVDLGQFSNSITENQGDPDGAVDRKIAKVTNVVGKVCDNLTLDREDYSKVGLTLESINPLIEILERLDKAARIGVSTEKPREAALQALEEVAKTFKNLLEGSFQTDDVVSLRALVETIKQLK